MRTALIGAVESSKVALGAMIRTGHPPLAVLSLPLDNATRHSDFVDLRPLANFAAIPIIESAQVNTTESLSALRALDLDYLFVVGWSQLLSQELLRVAHKGTVGYHPAALPEMRGRAVLPWTILLGKKNTAGSLFWLTEGCDDGDLLGQISFAVAPDETAATLYLKHMKVLDRLITSAIQDLNSGRRPATPQDHSKATYCAKRTERDGLIDWNQSAEQIWRAIRALGDPYPGAFTFYRGERLYLISADWVNKAPFHGIPGQIQELNDQGALVLCGGGGFVWLKQVRLHHNLTEPPRACLKIHDKLGIDILAVQEAITRGEII